MNLKNRIIAGIQIFFGVIFLLNAPTDFHLGISLILLLQGIYNIK